MPKAKTLDTCQDFMGTSLKVGDFIARGICGEMALAQITKIRLKSRMYWNMKFGQYIKGDPYIVCEIVYVVNSPCANGYDALVRPENTVYIDESRAMLYKLAK